jgi:hypothetical protein
LGRVIIDIDSKATGIVIVNDESIRPDVAGVGIVESDDLPSSDPPRLTHWQVDLSHYSHCRSTVEGVEPCNYPLPSVLNQTTDFAVVGGALCVECRTQVGHTPTMRVDAGNAGWEVDDNRARAW